MPFRDDKGSNTDGETDRKTDIRLPAEMARVETWTVRRTARLTFVCLHRDGMGSDTDGETDNKTDVCSPLQRWQGLRHVVYVKRVEKAGRLGEQW